MIGCIFRFAINSRKTAVEILGELTFEEIDRAEIHLLRSIQLETFGSNPNHLKNLHRRQKWIMENHDETEGEDSYNFKYPILIPGLNSGYVKCGDRERRECTEQAALIVKTLIQLNTDSNTSNVGGQDPADGSSDSKVIRRRKVLGEESRDPANCSSDFKGAGGHKTQGMNRGYCGGSPDSIIMWELRTFGTRGSVAVRTMR
ncbi:hypothetical protein JTB14_027740 [Gonioctena quinquepunctata]|nr:hypothetical protein JTB14_027740 [Gonioctena quinquepunctata]